MTATVDPTGADPDHRAASAVDPARATGAAAPSAARRADGVVLLGEMVGSGYRRPPALARRSDGQTIQLTPLLYALLDAVDGHRDTEALAAAVRARTERPVNAANVDALLDRLRELGLLARADGSQPELRRSNPLLGLRLKVTVTDPERTRRLTAPFAALFTPFLVVPVVVGFVLVCWWVLVHEGLASATHQAFAEPGLLLVVLAVTVLSGGFHELGHAAAAQRGGATPGGMGAGIYLVWPAFWTDVTDSYRLDRAGRLRTDLGGLYFNALVVAATVGVWWVTGWHAVLLVVATQVLQMLRQLLPLVRFDGYHVLADLTGVPDLFQRIGPTLRALVPWRATEPEAQALKPWARVVVTAWVLTVVPVLLAALVLLVIALPRVVGTALAAADGQRRTAAAAVGDGDPVAALGHGLGALVVLLPVLAVGYLLVRLVRHLGGTVWRRTEGRPARRAVAALLALAVVAALAWAWWPTDDRYRPVQAWEGGTIGDAVALARPAAGGLAVGAEGAGTVHLPPGAEPPTRSDPQLAAVLVPSTDTGTGAGPTLDEQGTGAADPTSQDDTVTQAGPDTWIFPFDEPLAPAADDNQALAVSTTDGAVTYDVAFALVWADGDEPVTTTNEAFAAASCEGCTAVAVAFQVVLVVGQADVAVPANLSVAVSYECSSCLTYALAVQLFVALDEPLSERAVAAVDELWQEVLAFGAEVETLPLDEIQDRLTTYQQQIIAIVETDQGPLLDQPADGSSGAPTPGAGGTTPEPGAPATASATTSATTDGSTTPTTTPGSTASPSTGTSTSPTAAASSSPSPTSGLTASSSPTPTATASSSSSATAGAGPSPTP